VKRKRLLITIFSFLAAVVLGALLWPRAREPEYNGVTISKWLDRWVDGRSEGFVFAISEMGTNATPFLLHAATYNQPRWRAWLVSSIRYWPGPLVGSRCVDWVLKDKSELRAQAALVGLVALGRKAEPALPELRRLAKSKDSKTSQRARTIIGLLNVGR
jgi:hypothetical protein